MRSDIGLSWRRAEDIWYAPREDTYGGNVSIMAIGILSVHQNEVSEIIYRFFIGQIEYVASSGNNKNAVPTVKAEVVLNTAGEVQEVNFRRDVFKVPSENTKVVGISLEFIPAVGVAAVDPMYRSKRRSLLP